MATKKKKKVKSIEPMKRLNNRIQVVKFLMFICIVTLVGRIGYFKFVKGEEFEKEVRTRMMSTEREVEALRGTIVDRNNKTVAASTLSYHIILDPKILLEEVKEGPRQKTYQVLAEYSGKTVEEIAALVNNHKDSHYKIFMKDISAEDMTKLKEQKIQGVYFEESFIRNYPKGSLAAQAIGFYNKTEGQYGVEQAYNKYLLGKTGRIFSRMQQSSIVTTEVAAAQNGHTVVLTIDEVIQQYVEQTMNKYVKELSPLNAAALVMNPKTGEIYAMYSYPYYDPNHYTDLSEQMGKEKWDSLKSEDQALALNRAWKNFNTQNPYEPGSTFKPLLVAAGLEEGYINPDTLYNCTGSNKVGPETIKCWKRGGHGIQTLEQALANSCNSAMIEISKNIPDEVFYDYFIRFGFNDITQIDLPGEATGMIHELNKLGPVQKATSSMGQSFTITPIQLITAFSSLINGGNLMQPYIVSSVVNYQNNIIMQNTPQIKRQIFSEEVASQVSEYMEAVVSYGTGTPAAVAGYTVGGKTGTAEKLPRGQDKHILSFMGYAPLEDPQVIALILFDEIPEDTKAQSLAFKEIMENVLPYLGIEPTGDNDAPVVNMAVVPSVTGLDVTDGITRLETEHLNYEVIGVGNKIVNQYPTAGTKLPYENTVKIYLEAENPENIVQVPNLIGLSLEDAKKATSGLFTLEGYTDEKINHQIPKAGTKIEKGHKIFVQTVQ
ncbi:MAG: penicillin-binding transpeptidase domain-containing protein [Clostridiales bacterium]|uniref:penicillin-binding transpeptidase domain-containing protein n=1 Tax=Zhenhengia sp. TaxID=2944208 RepID=UPI00290F5DD0|nr:penicillin-binding transpeptidase domain-containing protein [Clostridiales bacterium]